MFAKIGSNGLASKFQKIAVFVLALVVLFSALPAGKAYAWSPVVTVGTPGSVTLYPVYINHYTDNWGNHTMQLDSYNGTMVSRSPAATGAQFVVGQYYLERWNGATWVTFSQTQMFTRQIAATQNYAIFPNLSLIPLIGHGGYFRIKWSFVWTTLNGTHLGSTSIQSSRSTDHVCAINTRPCLSTAEYFRIGKTNGTW